MSFTVKKDEPLYLAYQQTLASCRYVRKNQSRHACFYDAAGVLTQPLTERTRPWQSDPRFAHIDKQPTREGKAPKFVCDDTGNPLRESVSPSFLPPLDPARTKRLHINAGLRALGMSAGWAAVEAGLIVGACIGGPVAPICIAYAIVTALFAPFAWHRLRQAVQHFQTARCIGREMRAVQGAWDAWSARKQAMLTQAMTELEAYRHARKTLIAPGAFQAWVLQHEGIRPSDAVPIAEPDAR